MATSKYTRPQFVAAFGIELLQNRGNVTAAVRATFPNDKLSNANVSKVGQRLIAHPDIRKIREEIERRAAQALAHAAERFGASADRAAEELTRLAFAQMRDVVDLSTVPDPVDKNKRRQVLRVRDFADISDDAHRAIVEVTQRVDGTVTIKLGDKQAAIMNLARLKGWIADKPEPSSQLVSLVIQR